MDLIANSLDIRSSKVCGSLARASEFHDATGSGISFTSIHGYVGEKIKKKHLADARDAEAVRTSRLPAP